MTVLFSLLFWCLPAYVQTADFLRKMSLETRDVFFKIRRMSSEKPKRASEVLVVAIDEESCQVLEARWPWSRNVFAKMIDQLAGRGAKVIGLNVSFMGLEDGNDASSRELARAMRDHGNVIVGATFDKTSKIIRPSPVIAEAVAGYGYLEKIVDTDFRIRRSYLLRLYSSRQLEDAGFDGEGDALFESSFPLALAAAQTGDAGKPRFDRDLGLLTVGKPKVGLYLGHDGSYVINYLASEADFQTVPAWKVIQGKVDADKVRGRTVLVGLTSSLFGDTHPTPLGVQSGIGIHANELIAVLDGRVLRFVPDRLTFLAAWLASLAVLALFLRRRFWLGFFGYLAVSFLLFVGAQMAFARDFVIEPFILLLGSTLAAVTGVLANSIRLLLENKGLETKVIHDKMTGLYKYEYLRECLEEEWRRCKRGNLPVSIVMTDLDRFKKINDTLGHEVGNQMIMRAGEVIKESARRYDIVSRYGGDEFVILLWHANLTEAQAYRTRLRDMYHAMAAKLDDPMLKQSSISIGVASYDPAVDPKYPPDPQRLIEDADKDLFTDKESRRKPGEERR